MCHNYSFLRGQKKAYSSSKACTDFRYFRSLGQRQCLEYNNSEQLLTGFPITMYAILPDILKKGRVQKSCMIFPWSSTVFLRHAQEHCLPRVRRKQAARKRVFQEKTN
ncbi:hypothetical protein CEXT_613431 [Caerostris extrusa]|uniref:Uncharacterized protein n=1 Tax=Caerostris extrusa TaxID=172846 RepID=A0AAV4R8E2_CAEEX|nr:hypothetical protein CEXT_613431 [Caerostris extrusa]